MVAIWLGVAGRLLEPGGTRPSVRAAAAAPLWHLDPVHLGPVIFAATR